MRTRVFQSSPGPRVGCNKGYVLNEIDAILVSILTRPEGRVQHGIKCVWIAGIVVSILTRPEGRVQRKVKIRPAAPGVFQSSPGPRVGCNVKVC